MAIWATRVLKLLKVFQRDNDQHTLTGKEVRLSGPPEPSATSPTCSSFHFHIQQIQLIVPDAETRTPELPLALRVLSHKTDTSVCPS